MAQVRLELIKDGQAFKIFALVVDEQNALLEFLNDQNEAMPDETAKLMRLLDNAAKSGPPRNEEKCRPLQDGIFEFKTRGGIRVFWFYDRDKLIICTHGFVKKKQKTPPKEIERALKLKKLYENAESEKTKLTARENKHEKSDENLR
ncbi:MAG: type II toxin-antitoxin system RelE/ParE family toxin [Verrucomicrobia bacterium]|nr:type II toxin-antitoxin system RelE/ParE family toxin [Verrucomicrobiota bacterium]